MVVMLIRFPEPAAKWLRSEARRLGISVAELARRIVDEARSAKNGHK